MPNCRFTFTHDDVHTNLTAQGVPKLYFDHFNHIRGHLDDIRSPKAHNLTRRILTVDWPEWEASDYKRLNQFDQQGMFADPILAPTDASVFNWVWTYNFKTTPTRNGQVCTLHHTNASYAEQTSLPSFFALRVPGNKRIYGAVVRNALVKAPPPSHIFYIRVDGVEAWTESTSQARV
jgi:hypothetical protein